VAETSSGLAGADVRLRVVAVTDQMHDGARFLLKHLRCYGRGMKPGAACVVCQHASGSRATGKINARQECTPSGTYQAAARMLLARTTVLDEPLSETIRSPALPPVSDT
jgi:hypothetical protein